MGEEAELVVYRVAQEALTNAVRHAEASRVELKLEALDGSRARLRVIDDGEGLDAADEGDGLRGMRERALLVGAVLWIDDRREGGVEVRLEVPASAAVGGDER